MRTAVVSGGSEPIPAGELRAQSHETSPTTRPEAGGSRCERFCSPRARLTSDRTVAVVGVAPVESYHRQKRLFDTLSEYFPVTFEPRAPGNVEQLKGLILFGATRERAAAAARSGVACYAVLASGETAGSEASPTVRFGSSASLPVCLRNRSLEEPNKGKTVTLRSEAGDEVMASKADQAVWLRSEEAGWDIHLVSMEPPALNASAFLSEHFNEERFMSL